MKQGLTLTILALVAGVAVLPTAANAQTTVNWRFQAIVCGDFHHIGGVTSFPERGGSSITVDASTIIDKFKFAFMGTFEARETVK